MSSSEDIEGFPGTSVLESVGDDPKRERHERVVFEDPENTLSDFTRECDGFGEESMDLLREVESSVGLSPESVAAIRGKMGIETGLETLDRDVSYLPRDLKASLFRAMREMGRRAESGLKALSVINMLAGMPAMAAERPVAAPIESVMRRWQPETLEDDDMLSTEGTEGDTGTERDFFERRKALRWKVLHQPFEEYSNAARFGDGTFFLDSGTFDTAQGGRVEFPDIGKLKRCERMYMEHTHPQNFSLGSFQEEGSERIKTRYRHTDHMPPSPPDIRAIITQAGYYRSEGATDREIERIEYGVYDAGGKWTYSLDSASPLYGKRLEAERDMWRIDPKFSITKEEQNILNEVRITQDILLRYVDGPLEDDQLSSIREKLLKRAKEEEKIRKRHFTDEELALMREAERLGEDIALDGSVIFTSDELNEKRAVPSPEKVARNAENIRRLCELYGKTGIHMEYHPYEKSATGK